MDITPVKSPAVPKPLARPANSLNNVTILKPGHGQQVSSRVTPAKKPVSTPQSTTPIEKLTTTQPAKKVKKQKVKRTGKLSKIASILSYIGIAILAIAIAFAFFDAKLGQWIVIAGGLIALILRVDSRVLFGAALFCLIMIPVMTMLNREGLSENYALYTFMLLAIGTVRAMIEAAGSKKHDTGPV